MFSGIVEETGTVRSFARTEEGPWRLVVEAHVALEDLAVGDSIAVNGCCLTAVAMESETVSFDLLEESVRLTNFQDLGDGGLVNLERALRYGGKLGGHFVSGHIDALGEVRILEARGADVYLRVEPPEPFMRYVAYKGSVAIDGISLTVAETDDSGFAVWLIPHTMEVTNLRKRRAGERVNLEFDLLAKYLEKLLPGQRAIERSPETAPSTRNANLQEL